MAAAAAPPRAPDRQGRRAPRPRAVGRPTPPFLTQVTLELSRPLGCFECGDGLGWRSLAVGMCDDDVAIRRTPDSERSYREFQLAAESQRRRADRERPSSICEKPSTSTRPTPRRTSSSVSSKWSDAITQNAEGQHLSTSIKLLEKQKRQGSILAEARNIYGLCLIELARYDEAIEVLRESATDELNTAPHLAWGNLGLAQFRAWVSTRRR